MIFVALGTHHQPFIRLVLAADLAAVTLGERVLVQSGVTEIAAPHVELVAFMSPEAFAHAVRDARVVVLHGGSSSFLQARAAGRRPIVVPRRSARGEHVDDHQVRFVASLSANEAAVAEPEGLVDAIRRHVEPGTQGVPVDAGTQGVPVDAGSGATAAADARSEAFCARFGALVDGLARRRG